MAEIARIGLFLLEYSMESVKENHGKTGTPKGEKAIASRRDLPDPRLLPILRSIIVITDEGLRVFPIEDISPERIGWKAYGLCSLPQEWVPSFFVIAAPCFESHNLDKTIDIWIAEGITRSGISSGNPVLVRSSGTLETMQNRGRLVSASCLPNNVVATIRDLIPKLPQMNGGEVHWIVQEYVSPSEKGHLSNERRLREHKRDWVAEFEPQGQRPGYAVPMAVRRWRDGTDVIGLDLRCASELKITRCLKRVAMWATSLSPRTHFEWVWDGKAVHIVQADIAEVATGVNPQSLSPSEIPAVELASLQVFHPANQRDYEVYGKLRNAKLYRDFGYHMPTFYIVDDAAVLDGILTGQISVELESDLVELTKRPLIIRTDGVSIPSEMREMLPRSDLLRSYDEARNWLFTKFKTDIEQSKLRGSDLCLIAHHFIPSDASAWARAEPGNRIVRIESLWGIPEGLYWYSHDTFEVDTQKVDIDFGQPIALQNYKVQERLRYKGTFIGSNEDGKWIPYKTKPLYDWKRSISRKKWLLEIAHTTRQVAEYEKYPVSVMWFIGNHPQATVHRVLPWFHSKSELTDIPKAAPRRKRKSARDFSIKNSADWKQIQQYLQSGKYIERVVVEPVDPELIRNPRFAEQLAGLAASNKFVVELSGGILSHAYYILQRSGAQVECIDLFGASEDIIEYNKVVRDKVPSLIESRGERVETLKLEGDALVAALRQKLVEEAFEALDAKSEEELIGELADVEEVVRALCRVLKVTITQIEAERKEKLKHRGGFEKGLMLRKTATPHSIHQESTPPESPTLDLRVLQPSEPVISQVKGLPTKPLYRRPDLRQVNQQLEKLFTFETETNIIREIKETLDFSMPIDNQRHRDLTLTVELRRTHSSIRGIVRLRLHPPQLLLQFPDSQFPDSQLEFEFPE